MRDNYYIFKNGKLKRKDNSLVLRIEKKNHYIPVENVDAIYLFGENSLNTKLIDFISQNNLLIHFFNYYGFYSGSFYPRESNNSGMVFINEVEHYLDYSKRLKIAKEFIKGSSYNIYRNIRYYHERNNDLSEIKDKIKKLREKIDNAEKIEELMGYEGNIKQLYYKGFNKIIIKDFEFKKRVKRPPNNVINTMISYLNTMVYTTVLGEIYKTQLSPLVSYLHEPGRKRFPLSLDVSEIFKPLIADRLIFSLLNKNIISKEDFEKELNFLHLKEKGQKKIIEKYDETIKRTIKHKKLKRKVSYQKLIRLELYKLIKHLIGEKEYKGFKIWW